MTLEEQRARDPDHKWVKVLNKILNNRRLHTAWVRGVNLGDGEGRLIV